MCTRALPQFYHASSGLPQPDRGNRDSLFYFAAHQMYECVSEVLLHLERLSGIVFMVQRRQIWPKNEKRVLPASFEKCRRVLRQKTPTTPKKTTNMPTKTSIHNIAVEI